MSDERFALMLGVEAPKLYDRLQNTNTDWNDEIFGRFVSWVRGREGGKDVGDVSKTDIEGLVFFDAETLLDWSKALGWTLIGDLGGLHVVRSVYFGTVVMCQLKLYRSPSVPDDALGNYTGVWLSGREWESLAEPFSTGEHELLRACLHKITRTFVYLDISDFSKYPPDQEALIINSLVTLVRRKSPLPRPGLDVEMEAMLCIGDGYIFVFRNPMDGVFFSAYIAARIDLGVARKWFPVDFHFRIGAHIGEVFTFWDPGRNDWNYIGDGINGGSRVLAAVGKEQDDVVFISGELRHAIEGMPEDFRVPTIRANLVNRGRKNDKHGTAWRVYEVNHMALCGHLIPQDKYGDRAVSEPPRT